MRKSTHTMLANVVVRFVPVSLVEEETVMPTLRIKFSYMPGSPAVMYQRNGDPGWPAESPEVELISAELVDGDGVEPTQEQINDWAENYLASDEGFAHVIREAADHDERAREEWAEMRAEMRREDRDHA